MVDRKPCLEKSPDVKLQTKFDIIKYHAYARPCTKSQALPVTAANMAEILGRV